MIRRKRMTPNHWWCRGYQDAIEDTPYLRSPKYPEEILFWVPCQAPLEVHAYFVGWNAGIQENPSGLLQQHACIKVELE